MKTLGKLLLFCAIALYFFILWWFPCWILFSDYWWDSILGEYLFITLGMPFYIFCCLICGTFAKDSKIGYWGGFVVTLLFSPIIGLLMIIASKK